MDPFMTQAYAELASADQRVIDIVADAYGQPWLTAFAWEAQADSTDAWRLNRLTQAQQAALTRFRDVFNRVRQESNEQAKARWEAKLQAQEDALSSDARAETQATLRPIVEAERIRFFTAYPGQGEPEFEEWWATVRLPELKSQWREAYIASRLEEEKQTATI